MAEHRGTIAELDAAGLAAVMHELAEIAELVGRAGIYAGLRFAVDTTDPARGALHRSASRRRRTAITRAPLLRARVGGAARRRAAALARRRAARRSAATTSRSARRYRPHLLTEPEEIVLTEKAVTGRSAWARLFSELTSTITVDLDGGRVSLEQGLSRLQLARPRRACAPRPQPVTEGLAPGLRTRAFVFNTLLADKAIDDRLRKYPSWIASRNLANEASDESVQALVDAVVRPATTSRSGGTRSRRGCSASTGSPTTTAWRRWRPTESEFGWREARELVLDAYGVVLARARRRRAPVLRRGVDRRAGPARQAPGRVLRVHRAVAPPVPAAQLDRRAAATC